MKIAYIIMAYKDPEQIDRLVKSMSHDVFDFYIHVDDKFDIKPFLYLKNNKNVYFFKKHHVVYWAAWNFTKTLILCIREVLESGIHYDFVANMSGQDYPIKSNDFITNYHQNNIGKSFFSLENYDSDWWTHAHRRVREYHLTNYSFPGRYKVQNAMNLLLPKRTFPVYKQLYGGPRATWWTMSADAARFVADTVLNNQRLQRFCNFTWCADEFLIPTVLMNSHFKDTVVNNSGRYIDWSQGGANPKILTSKDFEQIMASEMLYARKFDMKVDTKVLELIDEARQSSIS